MNATSLKKTIVDDCYFEWQFADGTKCADIYQAHADKKDVFAVVLHQGNPPEVIYREHRAHCHIDDAWRILRSGRFGKWKTTQMLITLRQALRERFAQGMPLGIPNDGIGEHALKAWLSLARAHDTVHHGLPTF